MCFGVVIRLENSVNNFYDGLAEYYHLIFLDWERSIAYQASVIDSLLKKYGKTNKDLMLDCACGIGTQTIGLAKLGYRVSGSDISENAINRARLEAKKQSLDIDFCVADFRSLDRHFAGQFDVVIAMDNALPHLLQNDDLTKALQSIYARTLAGGLFIASIRDYDAVLREKPSCPPPNIIPTALGRRVIFQIWDWLEKDIYHFTQYIIEDENDEPVIHKFGCSYRALTRAALTGALSLAGFCRVKWIFPKESGFYQPMVIAEK